MSLNWIAGDDEKKEWMKIYCESLRCNTLQVDSGAIPLQYSFSENTATYVVASPAIPATPVSSLQTLQQKYADGKFITQTTNVQLGNIGTYYVSYKLDGFCPTAQATWRTSLYLAGVQIKGTITETNLAANINKSVSSSAIIRNVGSFDMLDIRMSSTGAVNITVRDLGLTVIRLA